MCASSASRLCECWLPEERPAPNWVRTVSAICAAPPVMNGSFAAWFSSWSRHTPRKSRYISSTTGPHARHRRADAEADDRALGDRRVADPIAEAVVQAARQAEHVAAGRDVDAGDEDALVARELDFERGADRVHRAEHRSIGGRRGRLGPFGSGRVTKSNRLAGRGRASSAAPRRPASSSSRATDACIAFERVVGDTRGRASGPRAPAAGRALATPPALRPIGSAAGRLRSDRASGTSPPRRSRVRARRGPRSTTVVHRGRGRDDVVAVDRDVVDAVAGRALLERRRVLRGRRRELGVPVVLAEEDHRQLPHRGEVDRLVEGAVRDRAVAEERDRDACRRAAAAPRSRRPPRSADRHRRSRWRRRCRSSGSAMCIDPPRPRLVPSSLPISSANIPSGSRPFARQWPWPRCVDVITSVAAERPARADRRCLLPDREVHEARHLAVAVQRGHPLLEPADHEHPPLHLDEVGVAEHELCIVLTGTIRGRRAGGAGRSRNAMAEQIDIPASFAGAADVTGKRVVITGAEPRTRPAARARVLPGGARGRARGAHRDRPQGVAEELPGTIARAQRRRDRRTRSTRPSPTRPSPNGVASTCGSATRGSRPSSAGPLEDRSGGLARDSRREPHRRVPRGTRRGPGDARRRPADLHRLRARGTTARRPRGIQRVEGRPRRHGQGPRARPRGRRASP